MTTFYIASDGKGAGKTALACALAQKFSREGKQVGLFKPLAVAEDSSSQDADTAFFAHFSPEAPPQPLVLPLQELREGLSPEVQGRVRSTLAPLAERKDLVIAEGLSLSVLGDSTALASRHLVEALDARVILVVRYSPALNGESLRAAKELFGERLLGVLINGLTRYRGHLARTVQVPSIEAQGVRVLGLVPEDRRLLAVTVGQLAQHLEGEFILYEEKAQELVEHFLIGGLVLDWGPLYFERKENKAVLVNGGRPDIQMAALATPTACLVLTHGQGPIQYVYYEAERQGVPLIRVKKDTLTAATALGDLVERSTIRHPKKIARFQELLAQGFAFDAL